MRGLLTGGGWTKAHPSERDKEYFAALGVFKRFILGEWMQICFLGLLDFPACFSRFCGAGPEFLPVRDKVGDAGARGRVPSRQCRSWPFPGASEMPRGLRAFYLQQKSFHMLVS